MHAVLKQSIMEPISKMSDTQLLIKATNPWLTVGNKNLLLKGRNTPAKLGSDGDSHLMQPVG